MTLGDSGTRREARERALGLLYEAEAKSLDPDELIAFLPAAPAAFAVELVHGVAEHTDDLDSMIGAASKGWRVERMPAVDRALLRLAVYELAHRPDVPAAAVLTEAVDLAGEYSTERSSRFVNGVLSALAAELRPGELPDDEPVPEGAVPDEAVPDEAAPDR